jgi:predicted PurR-regulated permease PerM
MEIYKMSSDKEENNLKLTTSDILNALQHGATREDIAEIRQEMAQQRSDFNSRIDKLDTKIDSIAKDLDNKIDTATKNLDNKIDTVAKELDTKISTISNNLTNRIDSNFKWTVGIILVGILVPIVLHFIH